MRGSERGRPGGPKGRVIVVVVRAILLTSSQSELTWWCRSLVRSVSQSVSQSANYLAIRAEVVSVVADLPSMEIQLPRQEHYASQLRHYDRQTQPRRRTSES